MVVAYVLFFFFLMTALYLVYWWFCIGKCARDRQKTRDPQQRRMYVGSRARPSLTQQPPTIYVSPANLPPPPKYEAMAPPSYEEVVGIHYPNYQSPIGQAIAIQPITQPITASMSTATNDIEANTSNNVTNNVTSPTTVVTVQSDARRTSVTVANNS